MGTARILSPLCVFLSRSSFLSLVTLSSDWAVQNTPSPALACVYLCLFLFLSLSVLPAGCLFASSLLLLLSLVCVLSVLHLIFIRFYFPFLLRSFFFLCCAHFSFLRHKRNAQNTERRTENATVRWKRKIKNAIAIKIAWQTHCKMLHV